MTLLVYIATAGNCVYTSNNKTLNLVVFNETILATTSGSESYGYSPCGWPPIECGGQNAGISQERVNSNGNTSCIALVSYNYVNAINPTYNPGLLQWRFRYLGGGDSITYVYWICDENEARWTMTGVQIGTDLNDNRRGDIVIQVFTKYAC